MNIQDVYEVWAAVPPDDRVHGEWLMSKATYEELCALDGWSPLANPRVLLGQPVRLDETVVGLEFRPLPPDLDAHGARSSRVNVDRSKADPNWLAMWDALTDEQRDAIDHVLRVFGEPHAVCEAMGMEWDGNMGWNT